jgi:hypothetical protein
MTRSRQDDLQASAQVSSQTEGEFKIMTSEVFETTSQNNEPLPSLSTGDSIPPRPAAIAVIIYLLLLNAGGIAMYFVLFGRYIEHVALLPGALIPSWLQWQLFEAVGYVDFFIAIGLLWAEQWARVAYVVVGMLGSLLFFIMNPKTQEMLILELLFSMPCFAVFVYLLYREDAKLYFASAKIPRPRVSGRRRIGACFYVLAAVFAFWSFNAIVLGITEIYHQTLHRDKLAFLALLIILAAEWIGKTPGILSRLGILATAFAIYLMQVFLYKYVSPYAAQVGPSLWQLRNWAFGMSGVAIVFLCLQFQRRRQQ